MNGSEHFPDGSEVYIVGGRYEGTHGRISRTTEHMAYVEIEEGNNVLVWKSNLNVQQQALPVHRIVNVAKVIRVLHTLKTVLNTDSMTLETWNDVIKNVTDVMCKEWRNISSS